MQNLQFEDGYKVFTVNEDPDRKIRFNPADLSILERFNTARKKILEKQNEIGDLELNPDGSASVTEDMMNQASDLIIGLNQFICEQVDYIFNAPVSRAAFGNQSPLSTVKGVSLFERFLTAAQTLVEKELEAEEAASKKRVQKYTNQVKRR